MLRANGNMLEFGQIVKLRNDVVLVINGHFKKSALENWKGFEMKYMSGSWDPTRTEYRWTELKEPPEKEWYKIHVAIPKGTLGVLKEGVIGNESCDYAISIPTVNGIIRNNCDVRVKAWEFTLDVSSAERNNIKDAHAAFMLKHAPGTNLQKMEAIGRCMSMNLRDYLL